jgi:phosphatidylglycerol:prolipoprotein diacylglycerol transferase
MAPVLLSQDRFVVYSYQVVLAACLVLALAWLAWTGRRQRDGRLDAALVALAAGVLAGRIVHVLANWEYYAERPGAILSLVEGGLSFHAGLLAGLAALLAYAWWQQDRTADRGMGFTRLLGAVLPALALGLVGGWLACLLGGCAYGRPVPPPQRFYTPDWPDLYGVRAFRLPSQALGLALAAGLLVIAGWLVARPGLFLILYGVGDLLIAFTRGDLAQPWGPLQAVQWADLALVAVGLALEVVAWRSRTRASAEDPTGAESILARRQ